MLKATTVLATALSLVACEVQFTPQITPLVLSTAPPSPAIGTVAAGETLVQANATMTAEAEFILTLKALATNLAANKAGNPESAYYEEVICEDLGLQVQCFRLCIKGECAVFPNDTDHTRVQAFLDAVNKIEEEQAKLEDAGFRDATLSFTTLTTCGGVALTLALIDPEPNTKILLGLWGVLVAVGTCGVSILGLDKAQDDGAKSQRTIDDQLINAEAQFRILQLQASEG